MRVHLTFVGTQLSVAPETPRQAEETARRKFMAAFALATSPLTRQVAYTAAKEWQHLALVHEFIVKSANLPRGIG